MRRTPRSRTCARGVLGAVFLFGSGCGSDAPADPQPRPIPPPFGGTIFISDYARDFRTREDIAESFLPYLAIRYRSDRISAALEATILAAIPHRIAYFDGLGLEMHPLD